MTFVNRLKDYKLTYSLKAKKYLEKLDKKIAAHIYKKLEQLVNGEDNLDVKKLSGTTEPRFRLRINDIRVIYEVVEHEIVVYIIEIGHRREIYRG